MNDPKGYYKILELTDNDCNLSSEEFKNLCKKRYRKLCLQYHPDKQQGKSDVEKKEAEEKFKHIAEAYDILTDDNKKSRYDQFGTIDNNAHFNPQDIFSQIFGNGNPFGGNPFGRNPFADIFGGNPFCNHGCHTKNENQAINGENVIQDIKISLEDAYNGKNLELPITEYIICNHCHGKGGDFDTCKICNGSGMQVQQNGFMVIQSTCRACGGSGKSRSTTCNYCHGEKYLKQSKTIHVNIPQGIATNNVLRLAGQGKPGINGGQNGDILLHIIVNEDTKFIRKENDIYTVINIKYSDLLSNKELVLDVFGNKITFKIPIGHHILDDIIIKNKGFKILNSNNIGDLHIGLQLPVLTTKLDSSLYNELVSIENKIFNN